jgi:hypothetical protein
MSKHTVILRDAPAESVEIPAPIEEAERSCFGALRLFPQVPRTITGAELAQIERARPDVFARLEVREHVEGNLRHRGRK